MKNAVALWVLGALAILSAGLRLTGIASLSMGGAPIDSGDATYLQHLAISLLHFVPGTLFLLVGPLQFIPNLRQRRPALHRWAGRVFVLAGLVTAATAITMSVVFPPIGGPLKSAAVWLFSVLLMLSLGIAMSAILRKDVPTHRAFMVRAFALGLSISTMRLYFMPVYFIFGIPGDLHIGIGMWIGFVVNVIVAEVILYRGRLRTAGTRVDLDERHVAQLGR